MTKSSGPAPPSWQQPGVADTARSADRARDEGGLRAAGPVRHGGMRAATRPSERHAGRRGAGSASPDPLPEKPAAAPRKPAPGQPDERVPANRAPAAGPHAAAESSSGRQSDAADSGPDQPAAAAAAAQSSGTPGRPDAAESEAGQPPMPVRLPGRGHRLARRAIRTRSGPSRTRLGPAPSSLSLRHSSGPTGRRSRAQVRPGQDSELTRPPPPRQWPQPKRIQLPSRPGLRRVRPSSPGLRRVRTSSPGLRRVRLSSPGLRRVRTRANRVRLSATSPPAPRGPRSPKGPGRSWRRSAGRRCSRLARLATRLGSRARSPGGCRIRPHHGPRSSRRRCACGCGGTCRGAAPRQVRKQPGAPAPLGGWCCCASRWHSSRQPR